MLFRKNIDSIACGVIKDGRQRKMLNDGFSHVDVFYGSVVHLPRHKCRCCAPPLVDCHGWAAGALNNHPTHRRRNPRCLAPFSASGRTRNKFEGNKQSLQWICLMNFWCSTSISSIFMFVERSTAFNRFWREETASGGQ
jgi:hypothetical protein